MKILNVVGARPNFVKIAPILQRMRSHREIQPLLVHTGQHYSRELSAAFFEDMAIPRPDFDLRTGSGTHAEQTARVMLAFEPVLVESKPDIVLLVGDINSTLACALVAAKRGVPIAHVEAGLRSLDRSMPEEINRVLTDQLSELLFTTSTDAGENLRREGIEPARIHFVGNVMIDSLQQHLSRALKRAAWRRWGFEPRKYAVVTLHRPSNVDDPQMFGQFLRIIAAVQEKIPILFPMHPRTKGSFETWPTLPLAGAVNLHSCEPLGYLDFLGVLSQSALVLTDSGGVQEECTSLGVPCLTLRSATERPVTVTDGTNSVVGLDYDRVVRRVDTVLEGGGGPCRVPPLWDGRAAERIVDVLISHNFMVRTSTSTTTPS